MTLNALCLLLALLGTDASPITPTPLDTKKLAIDVWKKAGGEEWTNVQAIRFTYVEEEAGREVLKVEHSWNVLKGTDEVRWNGKRIKVDLSSPAAATEAREAFARWVNDSNWLTVPFKLAEPGVELRAGGLQTIQGQPLQAIHLRFSHGRTEPHDYILYIDQKSASLRYWDLKSSDGSLTRSSWEGYQDVGALRFSTEHRSGGKTIFLRDIKVAFWR